MKNVSRVLAAWMLAATLVAPAAAQQGKVGKAKSTQSGQVTNTSGSSISAASTSSKNPRRVGAPEISPALAVGGLILIAGGALVLTGRRREATA
jgi:LPXTG-motif cell wall-anchored protein